MPKAANGLAEPRAATAPSGANGGACGGDGASRAPEACEPPAARLREAEPVAVEPPDSPEAVALELLRIVARAEGHPVERRRRSTHKNNQPPRCYVLDLYAECLTVARGDRGCDHNNATRH